jgi:hypothetical protein
MRDALPNMQQHPAPAHLHHRLVEQGAPVGGIDGQHIVVAEGRQRGGSPVSTTPAQPHRGWSGRPPPAQLSPPSVTTIHPPDPTPTPQPSPPLYSAPKLGALPVQVAHVEVGLKVVGGAADGVLEAALGVVHVALGAVGAAQVAVGVGIVGLQPAGGDGVGAQQVKGWKEDGRHLLG